MRLRWTSHFARAYGKAPKARRLDPTFRSPANFPIDVFVYYQS
jgi:hypothetical protein